MRRFALASIVSISLMAGLGIIAMAQGPVPDCIYIASTAGAGVVPAGNETPVCEFPVRSGRHVVELGWTVGATGTATIEVAQAGGSGRFRLRCAVLGGISQCQTTSTVPTDSFESPFEVLGPFSGNGQRFAVIGLSDAATVTFSAGPYTHTFTCLVNDACVRAVVAEGIFGLTVNNGRDLTCALFGCSGPCEELGDAPQTEGASPSPTPTGDPTQEPTPCPGPTESGSATASPTPTPTS